MKVLLIIDMLKDFAQKQGALFCGVQASRIIPVIKQKTEKARKAGDLVIYVSDSHSPDDLEFNLFNKHCVAGTSGAEIIDELKPQPHDIIIKKTRFSGFFGTNLGDILKQHKPQEVEVTGVCTSICVMDTVGGLRNRNYKVVVDESAVADFDPQAHDLALRRMEKTYGAKVTRR